MTPQTQKATFSL